MRCGWSIEELVQSPTILQQSPGQLYKTSAGDLVEILPLP